MSYSGKKTGFPLPTFVRTSFAGMTSGIVQIESIKILEKRINEGSDGCAAEPDKQSQQQQDNKYGKKPPFLVVL